MSVIENDDRTFARQHVGILVERDHGIVERGLVIEECQLALDGLERVVAEEIARTKAGTIDDERLPQ